MLKTRIITALILAPSIIAAIYLLPLSWFAGLFFLLAALAANEFAQLAGLSRLWQRAVYVAVLGLLASASWINSDLMLPGLMLGGLLWLAAPMLVVTFPRGRPLVALGWPVALAGMVVCWSAWLALVLIRSAPDGATWLLWSMLLVWGADIGAYFAGRRFGRRKLAPEVSPGKTWEGVWGGALAALALCFGLLLIMQHFEPFWLVLIGLLIALSVFGDLFESVLKRVRGVKDSGKLLPGHGGVLDRIDSLLAVLPWLALILWQIGVAEPAKLL
jgi:phosphatidate cytidylyltransferase